LSLLNSISTAITGMTAQSASLANVSDNLANASTTGYKNIGTQFSDLVSTETVPTTGKGVRTAPVYYNNQQGSISTMNIETYLAVSGRGFFPVQVEDESGVQPAVSDVCYTRSGDFVMNRGGYLANSENYCLLGWTVDPATGIVNTSSLAPVQITDFTDDAVATATLGYEANLPSDAAVGYTTPASLVHIYDSLGVEHDVTYTWTKTGINAWDLTVSAPDAGSPDFTGTASYTFTTTGQVDTITSTDFTVTGTDLGYTLNYAGAAAQPMISQFADLTQFADETISVVAFTQDGIPAGSFGSTTIDAGGFVSVNYNNGVSRVYFQIPLATFNSAENLQRKSGTAFTETEGSGAATYHAANSEGAGKIVTNALENSTVDIAQQFTIMIQAQQAYAANSKTITTADSMLQTLITV